MKDKSDLKIARSYTLDPIVVAWVTRKAALLTIQAKDDKQVSDSRVVNNILTETMEKELSDKDMAGLKRLASRVRGKK